MGLPTIGQVESCGDEDRMSRAGSASVGVFAVEQVLVLFSVLLAFRSPSSPFSVILSSQKTVCGSVSAQRET